MRPRDRVVLRTAIAVCLAASGAAYAAHQTGLSELARNALATISGEIPVTGLRADVQVIRDEWGVPHIYAASEEDLFLAQGYVAAQDRLWQMEMWRRSAEGRLAEILGPEALPRDRRARLLRYRGSIDDQELTPYHPRARTLMSSFVAGVNAFIVQNRSRLPVEFVVTGMEPEPWTIETLVLRQIAFGDATGGIGQPPELKSTSRLQKI